MADPDSSKPEPSKSKSADIDFDFDFDLGDLDFEDNLDVDAPVSKPVPEPSKDALTKDLDALTAVGGKDVAKPPEEDSDDEKPDLEEEPDVAPVSEQAPEEGDDPPTAESPEEGAVEGDGELEEEMDVPPGEEDQIEPSEIEIDEGEEEIDIADDEEEEAPPEPEAPAKEAEAQSAEATEIVFEEDDELEIEYDEETAVLETAAMNIDALSEKGQSTAEDAQPNPRVIPMTVGDEDLDDDIATSDDDIAPLELATPPELEDDEEGAGDTDEDEQADAPDEVLGGASEEGAGKKSGLKLPSFRPLELAGIAAVMIVCLGALVMLSNTVSGMLKPAREAAKQTEKSVPSKVEGEKLSLTGIECYWRNRNELDRVDRFSTILPIVKIASGNGNGQMQIRFRDPEGKMRGDAHTFKLDGSSFSPGGASAEALSTEGLSNEVQFAAYRSGDEGAENDRWTAEILESVDGINWTEIVAFEVPVERRVSE
jgi:hypothetical protein